MTKCKALISFSAFGIHARTGQEFEVENRDVKNDLERLGWILPLEYEVSEVSEDMNVKEVKKTTKRAKQ